MGYPPEYYEKVLRDPATIVMRAATSYLPIRSIFSPRRNSQCPHQSRNHCPPGHRVLRGSRQKLSGRLLRLQERPGVSSVSPFHVRAARPSRRLGLPRWTTQTAIRQRGMDTGLQMDVEFDKVFDGFDGPFERIRGFAKAPAGEVKNPGAPGFLLSHQVNDAFIAIKPVLERRRRRLLAPGPVEVKMHHSRRHHLHTRRLVHGRQARGNGRRTGPRFRRL